MQQMSILFQKEIQRFTVTWVAKVFLETFWEITWGICSSTVVLGIFSKRIAIGLHNSVVVWLVILYWYIFICKIILIYPPRNYKIYIYIREDISCCRTAFFLLEYYYFLITIVHASTKRIKLPLLLWLTIFIYKTNNFNAVSKLWVKHNWFQLFYKVICMLFLKQATFS